MTQDTTQPPVTIGIDLGDRFSRFCGLDCSGTILDKGSFPTTRPGVRRCFTKRPRARIALEVGTHSAWMAELLGELGHEVIVANPRRIALISRSDRKNDRNDSETLARLCRADPALLSPIQHRSAACRAVRSMLGARDALVGSRTRLINCARGLVKAEGSRLPGCSSPSFSAKVVGHVPPALRMAVYPLLNMTKHLTRSIREMDRTVERLARERYPETERLRQVTGVGPLTALAFVLAVEDPRRFRKSRAVGAFFGLTPKQHESGSIQPQLRITKAGDGTVRRLLVQSAQYILGPFGKDCDLRRQGEAIAARGGKNARQRAVVAVARKLAVLLHRLWVSGERYAPLRDTGRKEAAIA